MAVAKGMCDGRGNAGVWTVGAGCVVALQVVAGGGGGGVGREFGLPSICRPV